MALTCVYCEKRIDTATQEFEEVGQIQFAHTECVEKDEAQKSESKEHRLDNQ